MEHIFTKLEEGLTDTKYMDLYTYVAVLNGLMVVSYITFARTTRWWVIHIHRLVVLMLIDNNEVCPGLSRVYMHLYPYHVADDRGIFDGTRLVQKLDRLSE